jgi:hypothetical protein
MRLRYADDSPLRLTDGERAQVLDIVAAWRFDVLRAPVFVDDGYDVALRSDSTGERLIVGRAGLHERAAKARLRKDVGLRGIFYPTATPAAPLLHQAAFYFDEVFIVHPGSSVLGGFTRRNLNRPGGDAQEWAAYRDPRDRFIRRLREFDTSAIALKQAGVLRAVPPPAQDHPDFLKLITADLDDAEFRRIAAEASDDRVFIAARKMEPVLPLVAEGCGDADAVREELHRRATYASRTGDAGDSALFDGKYYGVKDVDPTLAATILLNHAYLLADEYDLIPFTDDRVAERMMRRKLRRITELPGYQDYRRELNFGAADLAMRVLEERLPRFEFRDGEEMLAAREKFADLLGDFRAAMREFAAEIDESPYDDKFQQKIERVVATKVQPAIAALDREVRTSRDSFVAKTMRNVKTGSVPIVASIFVGMPTALVLGLSAGVLTFEAAVETYLEVRAKKRHGLTVFLKS